MGVTCAVTRAACAVGGGNQNITTDDLGGLTPVAALFIVTRATADGVAADHFVWSIGAATAAAEQWACCIGSEHNHGTSDAYRRGATDECVYITDPTDGTVDGEANLNTFIENGVTITWGNAPAGAYLLTVVFFAGTDVSAHADTFNPDATEDQATNVTDPGFEPDLVFFAGTDSLMNDASANGAPNAVGVVANIAGTPQGCKAIYISDNSGTSSSDGTTVHDRVYQATNGVGNVKYTLEIDDFDSDGFSAYSRDGGGDANDDIGYLALNFNAAVKVWCGGYDSPTGNGNDSDTSPGFKPQLLVLFPNTCAAVDTVYEDGKGSVQCISVIDGDEAYCMSAADEDNQGTTDSQSLSDNQAVNLPYDDGSQAYAATFVSFDATGWTLNFTNTDGTAHKWYGFAVEEVSAVQEDVALTITHVRAVTEAGAAAGAGAPAALARSHAITAGGAGAAAGTASLTSVRTFTMQGTAQGESALPLSRSLDIAQAGAAQASNAVALLRVLTVATVSLGQAASGTSLTHSLALSTIAGSASEGGVSLASQLGAVPGAGAVTLAALGLADDLGLTVNGLFVVGVGLTLAGQRAISSAASAAGQATLTQARAIGITPGAASTAQADATLGVVIELSAQAAGQAGAAFSLALARAALIAGAAGVNVSVLLAVARALAGTAQAGAQASQAVARSVGAAVQAGATAVADTTLSADRAFSAEAEASVTATLALALVEAVAQSGTAQASAHCPGCNFVTGFALTPAGGAATQASTTVSHVLQLTTDGRFLVYASLSLDANRAIAAEAIAQAESAAAAAITQTVEPAGSVAAGGAIIVPLDLDVTTASSRGVTGAIVTAIEHAVAVGTMIFPVPCERIYVVVVEGRAYAVALNVRTATIELETRSAGVAVEGRSTTVSAEDRTFEVPDPTE